MGLKYKVRAYALETILEGYHACTLKLEDKFNIILRSTCTSTSLDHFEKLLLEQPVDPQSVVALTLKCLTGNRLYLVLVLPGTVPFIEQTVNIDMSLILSKIKYSPERILQIGFYGLK